MKSFRMIRMKDMNKCVLFIVVVLLSSMSMACVTRENVAPAAPAESESAITTATIQEHPDHTIPVVEIILFHGTHRCTSCTNVGKWTGEVVHTYYEDAVENGTITFQEINAETNQRMAAEYGVRYVSLYINHEIYPDAFAYSEDHDRFVEAMRKKIDEELLNGS